MKKLRIISLLLLLLMVLLSLDLGFNFLKSTVPSMNDGIGCFSLFYRLLFGEDGWSQAGYLAAFETSCWLTFGVLAENIILHIISLTKKRA